MEGGGKGTGGEGKSGLGEGEKKSLMNFYKFRDSGASLNWESKQKRRVESDIQRATECGFARGEGGIQWNCHS